MSSSSKCLPDTACSMSSSSKCLPETAGLTLDEFVLKVDIVSIKDLGAPQYRLGDTAKRLLGASTWKPYVVVTCGSTSAQTPVLDARSTAESDPGRCLRLPLPGNRSGSCLRDLEVSFQVYDSREVQALLRGDPLVGEGTISLGEETLGAPNVRTVWLSRSRRGIHHGTITVQIGILAPLLAYDILASSPNRKLAQVIRAWAQVLVQPSGVDLLLSARPADITMSVDSDTADHLFLRQRLQTWVVQLDSCVRRLQGCESDQEAIWQLAKVMQSLRQLVKTCMETKRNAARSSSSSEAVIERISLQWVQGSINKSVEGEPADLDGPRLRKLVDAGRSSDGAVKQRLADFGVRLPRGLGEAIEFPLLARFVEAEQSKETDIFTGELIISNGSAVPGLAMVLRPGNGSEGPRVYLYDHAGIRRWVAEHGFDPTTRESISGVDIFPLTAKPWKSPASTLFARFPCFACLSAA